LPEPIKIGATKGLVGCLALDCRVGADRTQGLNNASKSVVASELNSWYAHTHTHTHTHTQQGKIGPSQLCECATSATTATAKSNVLQAIVCLAGLAMGWPWVGHESNGCLQAIVCLAGLAMNPMDVNR
jgi:hypothetical protein